MVTGLHIATARYRQQEAEFLGARGMQGAIARSPNKQKTKMIDYSVYR